MSEYLGVHDLTDQGVYWVFRSAANRAPIDSDGSPNTAFSAGAWNDYAVDAAEEGGEGSGTGFYTAAFPATAATGRYLATAYRRATKTSPRSYTDAVIERGTVHYDQATGAVTTAAYITGGTVVAEVDTSKGPIAADMVARDGQRLHYGGELLEDAGAVPAVVATAGSSRLTVSETAVPAGGETLSAKTLTWPGGDSPATPSTVAFTNTTAARDLIVTFTLGFAEGLDTPLDWFGVGFGAIPASTDSGVSPIGMLAGDPSPPFDQSDLYFGVGAYAAAVDDLRFVCATYAEAFFAATIGKQLANAISESTATKNPAATFTPATGQRWRIRWTASKRLFSVWIDDVHAFNFHPDTHDWDMASLRLVVSGAVATTGASVRLNNFAVSGPGVNGAPDNGAELAAAASGGGGGSVDLSGLETDVATLLERTSTDWAPWYVVPANDKKYRNLVISKILVDTLRDLDMQWPEAEEGLDDIEIPD